MGLAAVCLLWIVVAAPHRALAAPEPPAALAAPAGDQHDAFYAALAKAQAGDARGAADDLAALVARAPADLFADDALLERARLVEERLGDPVAAAAIYEQLVRDYPDSRLARRAERRAQTLRAQLGPGGKDADALAAWQAILASLPTRGLPGALTDAEALLLRYPEFGQADELRLWMAERRAQAGDRQRARAELAQLATRDDDLGRRALRSLADLLVELGHYDDARVAYLRLRTHAVGLAAQTSLDEALHVVTIAERKRTAGHAAVVVLVGLAGAALARIWRRAGLRALARPPTEALFVLPIALLFVLAGATENELFAAATRWLALAQLGIAYLVGVGLTTSQRPGVTLAWGTGGALAMLAATYLTIYHLGLVDLVIHTVVYGTD